MEENKELRFYEEPLFTWILLVIFPPLGIVALWMIKHYNVMTRIFISLLFFLLFLNLLGLHRGFIRAVLFAMFLALLEYIRQQMEKANHQAISQYEILRTDKQVNLIYQNYISLYHKDIEKLSDLKILELILETRLPLKERIYNFTICDNHYIKSVYKPLKTDKEVVKVSNKINHYYEDKFLKLSELVAQITTFQSKKHACYISFMLLREKLIEYKGKEFELKYHSNFKHCFELVDCVIEFIQLELDNSKNSKDVFNLTCYLIQQGLFNEDDDLITCYDEIIEVLEEEGEIKIQADFNESIRLLDHKIYEKFITIEDIDKLPTGEAFECFVAFLFEKKDYKSSLTNKNDQGVDVIIEKGEIRAGIQAKFYRNTVGNKAVQEINAGLSIYSLTKGYVITNNYFTKGAIECAKANEIILWDRDRLTEEIKEAKLKSTDYNRFLNNNKRLS